MSSNADNFKLIRCPRPGCNKVLGEAKPGSEVRLKCQNCSDATKQMSLRVIKIPVDSPIAVSV